MTRIHTNRFHPTDVQKALEVSNDSAASRRVMLAVYFSARRAGQVNDVRRVSDD
jgi:hypothetical protein